MPPKRKRRHDIESASESDVVPQRRSTASTLLPEVMQNIVCVKIPPSPFTPPRTAPSPYLETMKIKRDLNRKKITAEYDAYIDGLKKRIEVHYTTETKKRSIEAKALLTHYIEALEKQASIERSIELIVLNTHEDLKGLGMVLEAAFSGRQQQVHDAIGSFTPDEPVSAESAVLKPHGPADKDNSSVRGDVGMNGVRKEVHDDRKAGGQSGSLLDRISW